MKTKFRLREKEKIFKNIRENGYAILDNIYSKKQIKRIKNSLFDMLNYIKPDKKITDLQEKYYDDIEVELETYDDDTEKEEAAPEEVE